MQSSPPPKETSWPVRAQRRRLENSTKGRRFRGLARIILFVVGVVAIALSGHPVASVKALALGLFVLGIARIFLRKFDSWLSARAWWLDATFLIGAAIAIYLLSPFAGVIMPTPVTGL